MRAGVTQRRGLAAAGRAVLLAVLLAVASMPAGPLAAAATPSAELTLAASAPEVTLTSDAAWSLAKTGSLSGTTVTWQITASQTTTTPDQLVLGGALTVTNVGNGPATIGNIVVNLQKRVGNKWVTKSSDIANATDGDDATTANIHKAASSENKAMFSENGASGELEFMDATNNTLFSLVPQVMIDAGETRSLLFSASFDNTHSALQLQPGTLIRAEVIVTFGNATANGNSTANVDIDGDGVIENGQNGAPDGGEDRVRSVPSRLTVSVPPPVNGNGDVTLTDTLDDITATGDVTFSNVQINLGATSGTVTATVDGGANGGSITNCAHLTGDDETTTSGGFTFPLVNGVDLQACSTVTVAGTPTCTPGAPGCGWSANDMFTRTQTNWNDLTNWSTTYASVYSATFGIVEVGIPGTAGFSMRFGSTLAIENYLVAVGTPAALTADLVNPTTSSSGVFGGNVLALQLDVDFSNAGVLGGTSGLKLGELTLCNMTDLTLNNRTVSDLLALANNLLGGSTTTGYTISAINAVALELSAAFASGQPSSWAQDHLINGSCP